MLSDAIKDHNHQVALHQKISLSLRMARVVSRANDQVIEVQRIIGQVEGSAPGPTVIFMGGIHGNEPSGIFALHNVYNKIIDDKIDVKGNFYAMSGNLLALERQARFQKQDLNRLWTQERIQQINDQSIPLANEDINQQVEIYTTISSILEDNEGPFYFIDLHTTSSESIPFVTVNDSLLNRKFTRQYPVPMILGIEEYLDGPLLSLINEMGYVAFGFESGQHDALSSIENHEAFIFLTLAFTGSIDRKNMDFQFYSEKLTKATSNFRDIFEIYFRYEIQENENFKMQPGFQNFQSISKGQLLAESNGESIYAQKDSRIFMPLYQSQGDDGFFTIKKVWPVFLQLSSWLRKIRFDRTLTLLPGVQWATDKKDTLRVNLKIARFLAKQFFHLLGYRSKQIDQQYLILRNREDAAKYKDYENAAWYR